MPAKTVGGPLPRSDRNSHLHQVSRIRKMDEGVMKGCCARAGSPNVGRQLQDMETGYGRKVAIIGKKSCAANCQCRHNLERIRRLDSRCGSQLQSHPTHLCWLAESPPLWRAASRSCAPTVDRTELIPHPQSETANRLPLLVSQNRRPCRQR